MAKGLGLGASREMISPEAFRRVAETEEREQEMNPEWWREKIKRAKEKLKVMVRSGEINRGAGIGKAAFDFSLFVAEKIKKDIDSLSRPEISRLHAEWGGDYELEVLLAVWDALREQEVKQ